MNFVFSLLYFSFLLFKLNTVHVNKSGIYMTLTLIDHFSVYQESSFVLQTKEFRLLNKRKLQTLSYPRSIWFRASGIRK